MAPRVPALFRRPKTRRLLICERRSPLRCMSCSHSQKGWASTRRHASMGCARIVSISIYRWQELLSSLKKALLLYALTPQFLQQVIKGDELYTRVQKNVAPDNSQGWTLVLMDRATRFIGEMGCGRKQ